MNTSELIDQQIKEAGGWKSEVMTKLRELVHKADYDIIEEWKWGTGIYTKNGMVCAISSFKDHVKINFFKGAKLNDKNKLINAGLESKQHRAIDFKEGDKIQEKETVELIKEAISLNK